MQHGGKGTTQQRFPIYHCGIRMNRIKKWPQTRRKIHQNQRRHILNHSEGPEYPLIENGNRRHQSHGQVGDGQDFCDGPDIVLSDNINVSGTNDVPDTAPCPRYERKPVELLKNRPKRAVKFHTKPSLDETDKLPEPSFSCLDICFCLISIVTYLADVGSDIWVAYLYFTHEKWWFFGLTIAFVILPGLTITIFSLSWYIEDHRFNKDVENQAPGTREDDVETSPPKVHPVHWASRFMLLFLQMGPVMRYIEALIYGLWSKKYASKQNPKLHRMWYELMLYEDTDSSLLRLIECFMESAPQLVMQLYVLLTYGKQFGTDGSTIIVVGQIVSCVTALASLSWAMASYHRALRCSLEDKANMSYFGMAMQFVWRFFTVGTRVLALSLFASQFHYYVFVFAGGHWIVMLFWILILNTSFCKSRGKEIFFNIIMAVVYIFCYLNLVEGRTRLRYLFYYTIVYLENVVMVLFWYFFQNTSDEWYIDIAFATVLVGFFVGILFQVLYYLLCHPNNYPPYSAHSKIKPCVPIGELCQTLCNTKGPSDQREQSKGGQHVIYSKSGGIHVAVPNEPHDDV